MAMETAASDYVYGGQDNIPQFVEPGDYAFEVIGFECGISAGPKTRGSRQTTVKIKLEPSGAHIYETLIFAQSMGWKIDTFVKSTGIAVPIGQMPEELKPDNERLLIGLRGWCTVFIDEYKNPNSQAPAKKRNRVSVWITNKEKLQRRPPPPPEDIEEQDDKVPF
jgi:hypothetical protein